MNDEVRDAPRVLHTRRRLPFVLIGIASLLAFVAIFALWANRQLLDTENWTETSSELLEDDPIRGQTAVFLVDQLYANVDVQGQLEGALEGLSPRAGALAGPASGALKDLAVRATDRLLERPRPQALWEEANRRAHSRFLDVVEGGGEVVATEGGEVTLDLKALLGQTEQRVGVGGRAQSAIPEDAAQLTIMKSDQLELVQDAVRFLRALAVVLVVLALGLLALGVYLASGWRRRALRAAGFGLLLAGVAALVARSFAGDAVVGALATTEAVKPAAEGAWSISTSLLVDAASATIAYGVVLIGALGWPDRRRGRSRPGGPGSLPARAAPGVWRARGDRADAARLGPDAGAAPGNPGARAAGAACVGGRGAQAPDGARVPRHKPSGIAAAGTRARGGDGPLGPRGGRTRDECARGRSRQCGPPGASRAARPTARCRRARRAGVRA